MKATATAPSNLGLIKYWGKKDELLRLPINGSISMNLSNLLTTTTVEFSSNLKKDDVTIDDKKIEKEVKRVSDHLDRIREKAGITEKATVVSKNNFPSGTGLSSSASGFAALTVAASEAAGLKLSEKELSILARQGSGSACRSIPDGFVEWIDGETSETSYATSIFSADYWDICDVVVVVSQEKKDVSTTEGQMSASSSPFLAVRLSRIKNKIENIKEFIKRKNFQKFGELVEAEALELHTIMLTSTPSLIYLLPETIRIMKLVQRWRAEGLSVYFSLNTGQDVHLIIEEKNIKSLEEKLNGIESIRDIIVNKLSPGARLIKQDLF